MISNIKKGKHEKFTAKGEFSDNEFLDISMFPTGDGNKKIIQLFSDRAEPFIRGYKFIKGFKGGKLEYESIYDDKVSNSNLKISNFKVSKVPALTQLLTLASLQGIADTLNGEGIRFDSFEMTSESKDNILNIAAAIMQTDKDSLDIEDNNVIRKNGGEGISLQKLAETVYYRGHEIPKGTNPELLATASFLIEGIPFVFTNSAMGCQISIDQDTGIIKINKFT